MRFLLEWVIKFLIAWLGFVINNLFWINKGGEWYGDAEVKNRFSSWKGPVRDYTFTKKLRYVFGYRVLTVLTNWRDIVSAVIVGLGLTLLRLIFNL